jgi:ABC-type sugar transport system substrate-binding protein
MRPTRRGFLALVAAGLAGGCRRGGPPAVGFAQMDSGGAWRIAETASMRAAAERSGRFRLVVTDAQDQTAKQIADVEDLVARRVVGLFIAPRDAEGLEPAFEAARHENVPVFLIDREAEGEPGRDYVAFIGSDFVAQGRRAAEWLATHTGGKANVLELSGTPASSVARDRARGFREGAEPFPDVRIVASQPAHFARSAAQAVTANVLQSRGEEIDAIFAHNDEMALGAIAAVRGAGRRPGRDVTLVSIDGERAALRAILTGELGASVESNPRFGPVAFDALGRHLAGEAVAPRILIEDRLFDRTNAAAFIDEAY